jgi:UDP-3-O-[3-hydroxymyristoyl] glucosamine N-acyltransferase
VPFNVKEIIEFVGGRLVNATALGSHLDALRVDRPASLGGSQPTDLSFFFSRSFQHELPAANPGMLIIGEPFAQPLAVAQLPFWSRAAVIACKDPYLAMAILSEKFADTLSSVAHVPPPTTKDASVRKVLRQKTEIHPSVIVHPSVEMGEGVQIGAHCVVEEGVRIGAGTILYPGCFVGPKCVLGEYVVLFPRVTLYEWTELGDRVRIHAGSVLGADGFGYAPIVEGQNVRGHQKIYHVGRVVVGHDAEVGANTCIDRGTFGDTVVGPYAKVDNLVQMGHNSRLDEGAIICGGVCIAGNASVGKFAYVAGVTGIANHVHVGDGAKVGACSLVSKDVAPGSAVLGNPQRDYSQHFRAHALLNKLLADRKIKK